MASQITGALNSTTIDPSLSINNVSQSAIDAFNNQLALNAGQVGVSAGTFNYLAIGGTLSGVITGIGKGVISGAISKIPEWGPEAAQAINSYTDKITKSLTSSSNSKSIRRPPSTAIGKIAPFFISSLTPPP
jgi:hypothetical protein